MYDLVSYLEKLDVNWKQAIDSIDAATTESDWPDLSKLQSALNFQGWMDHTKTEEAEKRIKKYWVHRWICTDTAVVLAVYFFDGEPVAVSHQPFRKGDETIEFLSEEGAEKLRLYLVTLLETSEKPAIVNLETEIPEGWFHDDPFPSHF